MMVRSRDYGFRSSRPLLSVGTALLLAACQTRPIEQVETTAVVPVTTATATVAPLRASIAATGVVVPAPDAELVVTAPAAGRIAAVPYAEGQHVRAGDVLVRFDVPALLADLTASQSRVTQASARLAAADANLARLRGLLDQGVAAPRDIEDAVRQRADAAGDLEQARGAVVAASALSDRAVVRAPFSGVIAQRFHNAGDTVDAASTDPIVQLLDPSRLQVVAAVPAADLQGIAVGHEASVLVPGSSAREAATVVARAPRVDAASGAGNVRLGFVTPTSLTSGTPVRVEIVTDERPHALTIPSSAVIAEDDADAVMIVDADDRARRRSVTIGLRTRSVVEVTSGLAAGDRVIIRGQDAIPDGGAVVVQDR